MKYWMTICIPFSVYQWSIEEIKTEKAPPPSYLSVVYTIVMVYVRFCERGFLIIRNRKGLKLCAYLFQCIMN